MRSVGVIQIALGLLLGGTIYGNVFSLPDFRDPYRVLGKQVEPFDSNIRTHRVYFFTGDCRSYPAVHG